MSAYKTHRKTNHRILSQWILTSDSEKKKLKGCHIPEFRALDFSSPAEILYIPVGKHREWYLCNFLFLSSLSVAKSDQHAQDANFILIGKGYLQSH